MAGAMADRLQRLRFLAEGVLAEAQLAEPALLGLDVSIAAGKHVLCRSGRGDLRPVAAIVLADDGSLLLQSLPKGITAEQQLAVAQFTRALRHALASAGAPAPPEGEAA